MKVLVLASWYPSKMSEMFGVFVKRQVESLFQNGVEVGVLYSNTYSIKKVIDKKRISFGLKKSYKEGFPEYICYILKTQIKVIDRYLQYIYGKRTFKKYIKNEGMPDIIHLHVYEAGKIALWIKKTYNIPYVVTEHFSGFARGLVRGNELKLAKKVFARSKKNLAVSEMFKNLLEENTNNKFDVLPNSVDCSFFQIGKRVKNRIDLVSIGFLNQIKNFELLINSMAILKEIGNPDYKLTIIGDGPERGKLEKLILSKKLESDVSLPGNMNREYIRNKLSESYCLLSTSHFETFGIVVIEALASGIPCVVTTSGGPEGIINDDRLGIVSGFSSEEFADSIIQVTNKEWDRKYIREHAIKNYSTESINRRLIKIYKEAIRV